MKSPLENRPWLLLEEIDSTQSEATRLIESGAPLPGVILAHHQNNGKGRFDRGWHSTPGDSLTMSLLFPFYSDHPKPWLVGMAVALAAAEVMKASVQWPNDIVINDKKVAGVLTELLPAGNDKAFPVIGLGANVNQSFLPEEISNRATSLRIETGKDHDIQSLAEEILENIKTIPEPVSWASLSERWHRVDATKGKRFMTPQGVEMIASRIGDEGELIGQSKGQELSAYAADAWNLGRR